MLLTALTHLDLNGNQLIALPPSPGKLTALTHLILDGNQLADLPESLGNLTALTYLDLSGNQLPGVPRQLIPLIARGMSLGLAGGLKVLPIEKDNWSGQLLDRAWMRLRSLFVPSVSLAAVLAAPDTADPAAAILQLYTWERDRLLTLAKGAAGAAITVFTGLIAAAVVGKIVNSPPVLFMAASLVVGLLFWGGFLLTGLRRLAEEYAAALDLRR